jgi:alkylation response protein AidB-like acyl-CoA dehydrogenase
VDFEFTSEQDMLRDSVRKWVQRDYGFDHYQQVVKGGGSSQSDWEQLRDLGLTALAVPEAHDGLGMGPIEAMIVAEELGRGLVCEPWANHCLMSAAVIREFAPAALQSAVLPAIASGQDRVALALQERHARYDLSAVAATASLQGDHFLINGTKSLVAAADKASHMIVGARTGTAQKDIGLYLIDCNQTKTLTITPHLMQDGSRAAEVKLTNTPAVRITQNGAAALAWAGDIGRAALCAHAIGAMDQLMALTIDYLNTRKQFGVAIGTFQALRHRLADMKMQLELARSMSYFAHMRLSSDAAARAYAVAAAKYQVGQSARFLGQNAIQLHGGIGVTHEYSAGHYFKYLTAIELSLGDSNHQLGEVAARMQSTAGVFSND